MSVSATRTTPVSMPFKVRTNVAIAKAMIARLAATPSRFQPIRSLKQRRSAANSRYILPPGKAAKLARASAAIIGDLVSIALDPKTHKAKSVVCAALDNLGCGFGSAGRLCLPRNLAGLMGRQVKKFSGERSEE